MESPSGSSMEVGGSSSSDVLQSLCRLCGKEIARKKIPKKKLASLIMKAASIDIQNDKVTVHPPFICEPCEQKLVRWNNKNKNKAIHLRSELSIKIENFEDKDASQCSSAPDLITLCEELARQNEYLSKVSGNSILLIFPDEKGNSKLCLTVEGSGDWKLCVYGRQVRKEKSHLNAFPDKLSVELLPQLITCIATSHICQGNPEYIIQECKLRSKPAYVHYQPDSCTVRHDSCPMIMEDSKAIRCEMCRMYRSNLAAIYKRSNIQASPLPKTNYKHMKQSKLAKRLKASKEKGKIMKRKINKLEERIKKLFDSESVKVNEENSNAFKNIFTSETENINKEFLPNSPQQLLWEEQKKCLQRDPRGIRWHPAIIRLCIALSAKSSSAYNLLRSSGFLTLPTQRTLRCYTHFTSSHSGFNKEFIARVCEDIKLDTLPDMQRNIMIAFDEMKVSQGLVYTHNTGEIIGFTSLGSLNDEMSDFARRCEDTKSPEMASHVLVLMARSICSSYCRPIAYFATEGATADQLYHIVMQGIEFLEHFGFSVRGLVSDGATPNRALYKLLTSASSDSHFFVNPFTGMPVYLFSDVPHLVKTTRNNMENSGFNRNTRNLKFRGLNVSWQHLLAVYEWDFKNATGLRMLHRLSEEHLRLTPTHRMKVKLAAQVLSSTMANALKVQGDPATESTRLVIEYFNQFFDCLNVSSRYEGDRKRNPALQPYKDVNDWRFIWLTEDFLGFLEEWETEGNVLHLTASEREKLHLSKQTLEGIRMTVNSFVKLSRELLSEGAEYILSEKFSQDPVEEFFAKQRSMGGGHDNPTVSQFGSNMLTLQVAGESVRASKRANVASSSKVHSVDDTPIPRKRLFKK